MKVSPPAPGLRIPAILIVGAHDSGKTGVAVALIEGLAARGYRVGSVKHTGHDYETDVLGKDSQRHAAAGANPSVLVAGSRVAVHRRVRDTGLAGVLGREMEGVDVAVVEGFRAEAGLPKVEVVRSATGRGPLCEGDGDVLAVVTDRETSHDQGVPRLRFDERERLLDLVVERLGLEVRR